MQLEKGYGTYNKLAIIISSSFISNEVQVFPDLCFIFLTFHPYSTYQKPAPDNSNKIGLKLDCFTRDNMKKTRKYFKAMIDYCNYVCTKLKQL